MGLSRALSRLRLGHAKRGPAREPRCPSCLSEHTASMVSTSPEVYSFRCLDCQHEWSQLIRTPMPHWSDPIE